MLSHCDPVYLLVNVVRVALDNHDIISMKLYQLTIERSLEEEQEEEDVTVPRVDDMDQFTGWCT